MGNTGAQAEAGTSTTSDVRSNAEYTAARQVGVGASTDTAGKPTAAETVSASRTSGSITVRLIPVPARGQHRGTAA